MTNKTVLKAIAEKKLNNSTMNRMVSQLSIILKEKPSDVSKKLDELVKSNNLIKDENGNYSVIEETNLLEGKIITKGSGYGFFKIDDSDEKDIFIPAKNLNGAMNNDKVLVKRVVSIRDRENSDEGEVVRILTHGVTKVVGTLKMNGNYGFIIPDDNRIGKDIFVHGKNINGAKDNQKVVAKILNYNDGKKNPDAEIIEVLGYQEEGGVDITSILRQYDMYEEFPEEVLRDAKKVPQEVPEEEIAKRKDYRDLITVTIDGEDSRDFDDAISARKNADGTTTIYVHIADVSNYIKQGTPLFEEAVKRGTSAYFPDRVLPMLPKELSNGICSLNEGKNRLVMTCEINLDSKFNIISSEIHKGVIKSTHRMTYNQVTKIFDGDEELRLKYADTQELLDTCLAVSRKLTKDKQERGAIEFDSSEPYIKVDENGRTIDILKRVPDDSHKLIEALMITANTCVAKRFKELDVPFIYRVHEQPVEMKMEKLLSHLGKLGITMPSNTDALDVTPKMIQGLMDQIKDEPYSEAINRILLRTMQKAKYMPTPLGHYGLAEKDYTHFTSPIRRLCDLYIHMVMSECLKLNDNTVDDNFKLTENDKKMLNKKFDVMVMSDQASQREVLAQRCEYDVDDLKKAEFINRFIGKKFRGTISGLTRFGIFVELDNTVEGLIKTYDLPEDDYTLGKNEFTLIGNKHIYTIGDEIDVRVKSVNMEEAKVSFSPAEKALINSEKKTFER